MLRKLMSCGLILLTPCVLLAQETSAAMLYGTGSVYVNGAQVTNSLAVTSGDVIQTKDTGAANLSAPGASVVVQSNTIARFESGGLALDRGSISVATGKSMPVFARDFKITPASGAWTEFYVTRASGAIQIIARKNAITVSCGANTATVKEGQQISRDDAADCGIAQKRAGAPTAAHGAILTSPWVEYGALGAGGGVLIWALTRPENPVSPSVP
jgi:hypothetical protein